MIQTVCDTLCSEVEVETVLYFSSLATIINTWRLSLRATFMKWAELRGLASSLLHASRQLPTCLTGRRGAVDVAERFLLERPWADVVVVLQRAWCSKETAHKRTTSFGALGVEGELDATRYKESHPLDKSVSFGDFPTSLADDGGCILQCQEAASSLPQVVDARDFACQLPKPDTRIFLTLEPQHVKKNDFQGWAASLMAKS